MKKPSITLTKTLQKMWQVFQILEKLEHFIDRKNAAAFSVSFIHAADRSLLRSKWSDQSYTGSIDSKGEVYEYTYEITSRGISFVSFDEKEPDKPWWHTKRSWFRSGNESTMRLIDVPNLSPPNYDGTMYVFHQEKIKETLAALPAWAIVVAMP